MLVFIGSFFLQISFIVVWIKILWKDWKIDNMWWLIETIHYHKGKWIRKYCCFGIYSHYCTYHFHLTSYFHGRQVGNTNTVIALLRDSYRLAGHMMTPSDGNIFRVTSPLCGEFTGRCGEFPSQRHVTRSFGVFFDLHLNDGWVHNRESGDLRRHRSLWRHCNEHIATNKIWRCQKYYMTWWKHKNFKIGVAVNVGYVKIID